MPASQLKALRAARQAKKVRGTVPHTRRPGVVVPTTYIWGRNDFALGRAAAEMTEEYVEADYAFIELDAGHWLPELNAEDVADAVIDRIRSARGGASRA
ncbi:alpha/beta fold hydrolase [Luteipulveratus halotolerans]|uniref:alpha/beta fold hydrolase n=1 Tax=Luteipulveratus halotolerans TaxID=1631356 RepID=UPI0026B162E2